jgi:DNA-binding protein HU-beta
MTKAEVAKRLKKKTGLPATQCAQAVEVFLSAVKDSLGRGEKASLIGLGTFDVRVRAERNGLNPRTKQKIRIPAKHVVKFVPGKAFRERVASLDGVESDCSCGIGSGKDGRP